MAYGPSASPVLISWDCSIRNYWTRDSPYSGKALYPSVRLFINIEVLALVIPRVVPFLFFYGLLEFTRESGRYMVPTVVGLTLVVYIIYGRPGPEKTGLGPSI